MSKSIIEKLGISDKNATYLIETLNEWKTENLEFSGTWYGYCDLEDNTGITISSLKKIMKEFRENGIVNYESLLNDEYMIAGSGYILNDNFIGKSWLEIKELLK